MSNQNHTALELAVWLKQTAHIHQETNDAPGGYYSEYDQKVDEAQTILRSIPELEFEIRKLQNDICRLWSRIEVAEQRAVHQYQLRLKAQIDAERQPTRDWLLARVQEQDAEINSKDSRIIKMGFEHKALVEALEAILDFAGRVAGGSSWWQDIWPLHEAAIDNAKNNLC